MKKIWSFTTVKDEEDIIESFVRYNMNIVDGMVISDNGSNDHTLKILEKLKEEGYNLDILVDDSQYFDQMIKRNDLLQHTIKKHHPDIIVPLDADEFICMNGKGNPRKELLKLKNNILYRYKMKNYVINKEDSTDLFIPKKMQMMRTNEEDIHHNYKCIITKSIYQQGIVLQIGSHSADFIEEREMPIKYVDNLYLSHFPVRSKYQLINKIITGRLNNSSLHSREEGFGFHQYEILDEIIKDGTISDDTLREMSETYSMVDKKSKFIIKKSPMNLAFCKKIDLKYTVTGNDDKLLSNTIKTSLAIINHMREENKKEHEIYEWYKSEFEKVINSKTWRYKEKLIKIIYFWKKSK